MRVYAADEEVRTIHLANMIAILNHRGDVDWMLGYSLCDRFGNLQVRLFLQRKEVGEAGGL